MSPLSVIKHFKVHYIYVTSRSSDRQNRRQFRHVSAWWQHHPEHPGYRRFPTLEADQNGNLYGNECGTVYNCHLAGIGRFWYLCPSLFVRLPCLAPDRIVEKVINLGRYPTEHATNTDTFRLGFDKGRTWGVRFYEGGRQLASEEGIWQLSKLH